MAASMNSSASPITKSQISARALKLNYKPNQLWMRSSSSSSSSTSNYVRFQAEKFMFFNHKPNHLWMKSETQMKPMAMLSSSSSNYVRFQANDHRRPEPPSQRSPIKWLMYIGIAFWTLLFKLLGSKRKVLHLAVILHDEDGLVRKKFHHICKKNKSERTYKRALDESVKCLLENADSCISSSSMVCSNYLQVVDNMYKLYDDDFTLEAFADDDINCTQIHLHLGTFEEISDENIHTIQDLKAFLRKLGSIERERIVLCFPCNCYKRKGPIQRQEAFNRYSHVRIPI